MAEFYLLQYTDAHGRYLSQLSRDEGQRNKGLDRFSTYLQTLRSQGAATLIIDNGDSIQGQPLVDLWTPDSGLDHPLNLVHRALGVDAFILGNHEFNFGLEQLKVIQDRSQVPWITANILRQGQPVYEPFRIFERGGIKVGVLGLITEFVPKWEAKSALGDLQFQNVIQAAKTWVPRVRELCDLLVVSYHGGFAVDPITNEHYCSNELENQGYQLWEEFRTIDVLFTGHQHRKLFCSRLDRALMLQPGAQARYWAEVAVEVRPRLRCQGQIISAEDYPPDPDLARVLAPNLAHNQGFLAQVLGTADPSFAVSDPLTQVWTQKHPLIQWINELMLQETGAMIAASSLLDKEIKGLPTTVTQQDVLTTYFFHDAVSLLEVDKATLVAALEKVADFFVLNAAGELEVNPRWAGIRIKSYNYDIFEGIEYELDISRPLGQRLTHLTRQGQPIADDARLTLALTTYRAGGGFYEMFNPEMVIQEFPAKITDLMSADLKARGHLQVIPQQNFHIRTA